MSNLKVNAKTKILEFKRKHNKLVDEIPTQIANALVADKDIISKIEINVIDDEIIFPKTVLPLQVSLNGEPFYFDYKNEVVLSEDGDEIIDVVLGSDDYRIIISGIISFIGVQEIDVNECIYLFRNINNVNPVCKLNSYNLFFPVKESGTKLYKHNLTSTGGYIFTFISNESTNIRCDTLGNLNSDLNRLNKISQFYNNPSQSLYYSYQGNLIQFGWLTISAGGVNVATYNVDSSNISTFTDVVTEL